MQSKNIEIASGFFRRFWHSKEHGQIFPLLVVILVLMLVAVMAFINTSQVSLRKLATMNAADAGANAGASQLATAANRIADVNADVLVPKYLVELAFAAIPKPMEVGYIDAAFLQYIVSSVYNLYKYMTLLVTAYKAVQQAGASAISTAFANIPTEEATRRIGSPSGKLAQPLLSKWLDEQGSFYSTDTHREYTYPWNPYSFNITSGTQVQQPQSEEAKVIYDKPEGNALLLEPMPVAPMITPFYFTTIPCIYIPPTTIDCDPCWPSILPESPISYWFAYEEMVTMSAIANAALIAVLTSGALISFFEQENVGFAFALATLAGIAAALSGTPWCTINNPPPPEPNVVWCGLDVPMVWWEFCFFFFPLPFILAIINNDAEITVTVERYSPEKNSGLFISEENRSSSAATAGMTGGSVFSPGSYGIVTTDVD